MNYFLSFLFFLLTFGVCAQVTTFEQFFDFGYAAWMRDVSQTSDGGYIMAGGLGVNIGVSKIAIVKTDSLGNEEWRKIYGNPYGNNAHGIRQLEDNGYMLAGATTGDEVSTNYLDIYVIRLDELGDTLWTKTYGNDWSDNATSMERTQDGGFIIVGYSQPILNGSGTEAYVLKIDSIGNLEWEQKLGEEDPDLFFGVDTLSDGGYILCGRNAMNQGDTTTNVQAYLVRLDEWGDTLWTKTYGWYQVEVFYDVIETSNGDFIAVGYSASFGDNNITGDILIIKTNSSGDTLWTKVISGQLNSCVAKAIVETDQDEFIMLINESTVETKTDNRLIKFNTNGDIIWNQLYQEDESDYTSALIKNRGEDSYLITGANESNSLTAYAWLFKVDGNGLLNATFSPDQKDVEISIFPNPSLGIFNIEDSSIGQKENLNYEVYNIQGELIKENNNHITFFEIEIDLSGFPTGIYFLKVIHKEGNSIVKKLLRM